MCGLLAGLFGPHLAHVSCVLSAACGPFGPVGFQQCTGAVGLHQFGFVPGCLGTLPLRSSSDPTLIVHESQTQDPHVG